MTPTLHVREVLAEPERFDGQPVSVYGIYMRFQENQCLDDASPIPEDEEFTEEMVDQCFRLWLKTDAQTEWSHVRRDYGRYSPVIVSGIYSHGLCGHRDRYPGQLVSIKTIAAAVG